MSRLKQDNFIGELLHFHSIRMRVNGSGLLQMSLFSLDDLNTNSLVNLTLAATTNREPVTLSNFTEQRAYLQLRTTGINEYFVVSKIVIFVKPVATGYPQ